MYLRLKPSAYAGAATLRRDHPPTLSTGLRDALIERNSSAFDWFEGGQPGPLKFVDLHQVEYAVRRAVAGDLLGAIMVRLYLDGIGQLVITDRGSACQYSVGTQWNNRNRVTTLAGQAVVLEALALGAAVCRRKDLSLMGIGIRSFVRAHAAQVGLYPLREPGGTRAHLVHDLPRPRDNAWYAAALHRFAEAYELPGLRREAIRLFESALAIYLRRRAQSPVRAGLPTCPCLDDAIALAAALTHFGVYTARRELLRKAGELLDETARYCALPHGGYGQRLRPNDDLGDLPVDIDCTIDLVRTCVTLAGYIDDARMAPLALHGMRALFDPSVALARQPECGVLLVAEDSARFPPTPTRATTSLSTGTAWQPVGLEESF